MGAVVLGDDQQARRVLVEPVHDAWPPHAADARQAVAAMGDERVDQRAGLVPGRRMDDEPGRLVDHQQVGILVDDVEGNVLALGLGRHAAAARRPRRRARLELSAGIVLTAVPPIVTRPSSTSALSRVRDKRRDVARQEPVQPLAFVLGPG